MALQSVPGSRDTVGLVLQATGTCYSSERIRLALRLNLGAIGVLNTHKRRKRFFLNTTHTKGSTECFLIRQTRQNASFRGNPLQSHNQRKNKQITWLLACFQKDVYENVYDSESRTHPSGSTQLAAAK